ncbi:MAG: hypothetical protein QOG60_2028 [Frankiaceae bacterium]|nr:hypothetical protein [Frankiaceae bacterium]
MTAPAAAPTAPGRPTRRREQTWRPFVGMLPTLLVSWLVARVVVGAALALSVYLRHQATDVGGTNPFPHSTGLLGWDSAFYRDLADKGYGGLPVEARRFFPLLPLVVRIVGLGTFPGPALLIVVNLTALAFAAALWRLVVAEGWGDETGERAVWLLVLAPPAFVLVMGYTEALAGLAAVLVFLGLRREHWWLAAGAGAAAALCRPTGLLLCVPGLIEAVRQHRRPDGERGALLPRAAAVVAPLVGAGLYFVYLGVRFGDPFQPLRIQQDARLHGPTTNPVTTVLDAARGLAHGEIGTGLHVPWLIVVLGLLVVMARTLPASYTAWCACTLAGSLVGTNLDSFERYAWSAFPFVIVGARLLGGRPRLWQAALAVTAALLASYALLAFLGLSVP